MGQSKESDQATGRLMMNILAGPPDGPKPRHGWWKILGAAAVAVLGFVLFMLASGGEKGKVADDPQAKGSALVDHVGAMEDEEENHTPTLPYRPEDIDVRPSGEVLSEGPGDLPPEGQTNKPPSVSEPTRRGTHHTGRAERRSPPPHMFRDGNEAIRKYLTSP